MRIEKVMTTMHIANASIAISTLITIINCELYQNSEINTFGQYHFRVRRITGYWLVILPI